MIWSLAALAALLLWSVVGPRVLRGFQRRARPTARVMVHLWTLATALWLLACFLLLAILVTRVMGPGVKSFVFACVDLLQAIHDNGAENGVLAALLLGAVGLARLTWTALRRRSAGNAWTREHVRRLKSGGRLRTLHTDRVWVLPTSETAAYCLPGRQFGIVVTQGALDSLTPAELSAVLAHERAHLSGRHHILVGWARLLDNAFPAVPLLRAAASELPELVEWAADDQAARETGPHVLAHALGVMARAQSRTQGAEPALAAAGACPVRRVRRQLQPAAPPAGWAANAAAALVVVLPLALTALATLLNVVLPYCDCVG
ncbi:M56 family metallopeptidase [Nocardiopsis metallicus]|uniref:Zn-dependent protease with chaperone function n=1 Tax=Nocardiopsis metallicus TaxID=179819 RepID=A0A840WCW0_9ACTN|nr:M56 family metallopeptidase [Nocardiopsis metallicus]MBB5493223.1 Zn-dependent protease with chaperone function [Nocardiopsis metallicus]